MQRALRCGRGAIVVDLPSEGCRAVLQPKLPPVLSDLDAVVARCVEAPVGGEPLSKIVRDRERIVLAIPDATRGEVVPACLPPLLHFLERVGVARERVTILTATGAHPGHTDEERAALVGREIAANWTVVDHDPDGGNVDLEPLDEETPLAVDARALEADCLILAGAVRYHYLAGYGGGRKLVAPGLCSRATVQALHRKTLANIEPSGQWHSRTGVMRDNPFHEALVEAARRVGPHFALNVAVGWQGQVVDVVAGDPFESHTLAALQYDQIFRCIVRERLPVVIASCGGEPFDLNFYQAHKALDNAFRVVRRGGTIILMAECRDGWGPESFVRWLAIESLEEHRERLMDAFEVPGHTTYALKWKATQCRIIVVSKGLAACIEKGDAPAWLAARPGKSPFRLEITTDVAEAFDKAATRHPFPHYVLPVAASCLPQITAPAS